MEFLRQGRRRQPLAASLAAFGFMFAAAPAFADRNCTGAEKTAADAQLWLNTRDKNASVAKNLPWGAPDSPAGMSGERLLVQRDYVTLYDDDLRDPVWVGYRLEFGKLGEADRINCFRRDARIDSDSASTPTDYKEPIFDQGHMAPNSDMSTSEITVINSFVMSNMTPQYCQFNRGVWQILESIVRLWAKDEEVLYVTTGSVFDRDGDTARDDDDDARRMESNNGKTRVAIPTHFYKVLAFENDAGELETLSILLPNDQTDLDGDEALDYLAAHVVELDDVEQVTGLSFFPARPGAKVGADGLWIYSGEANGSLVFDDCRATAGAHLSGRASEEVLRDPQVHGAAAHQR